MVKSTTSSASKTLELGAMFARACLKFPSRRCALVLALQGDLGTGKTTFTQGFAKGLGIQGRVLSPTFIIFRRFAVPKRSLFKSFFQIDCYRLRKPADLLLIGWRDIVKDPSNIVVLEWPERVAKLLPKDAIIIRFSYAGKHKRTIAMI
ncbi:MAG: tRNA (adenosine(37)-N6)-threonylcarbamoyltransferase complex ATPase subunit type 1 TsaE [Parcubacteria group bacterium]|nr:tRNA (adenosine(37)-N6)-threonylcarbamoyltransferase complex ATPase subunit type 1 TsaE [Parcubacteria group bacterium]